MTEGGSKYMKITLNTETGEVVEVVDENGNEATRVDPEEVKKIYHSKDGLRYVGLILHAHSSPGCFYWVYNGYFYQICQP